MNARMQRTLARPVTLAGVGLHTGEPGHVTFRPAAENSGVRFVRNESNLGFVRNTNRGAALARGCTSAFQIPASSTTPATASRHARSARGLEGHQVDPNTPAGVRLCFALSERSLEALVARIRRILA